MKSFMKFLMPGGRFARHQTLIFHRVLNAEDAMMPDEPTTAWFDDLVAYLDKNFTIISLYDAINLADKKRLPKASISITFDDGYADNFTNALPVLQKYDIHATFFIASGFLNGGRMWNDSIIESSRRLRKNSVQLPYGNNEVILLNSYSARRKLASHVISYCKYLPIKERDQQVDKFSKFCDCQLPNDLMMTTEQLVAMSQSPHAEIGGHTRNHPILANCSLMHAEKEIKQGLDDLENLTGIRPRLFAYPNGKRNNDYTVEQTKIVSKLGVQGAVSTDWGVMSSMTDKMQIPRFTPWVKDKKRFTFDLIRARYGFL